jgi:hypothetical protein
MSQNQGPFGRNPLARVVVNRIRFVISAGWKPGKRHLKKFIASPFDGSRSFAMRIAMIAPLMERVPPLRYGGTERIVSYLTEDLVRQGQDVTLFASGDSLTAANWCHVPARLCG